MIAAPGAAVVAVLSEPTRMALVAHSYPGCKPKDHTVQDALSRNPLRFVVLPRCLEDAVYPVDWRHIIGGF